MPEQKRSVSAYFFSPCGGHRAGRGQRTLSNRAGTTNQADTGPAGGEGRKTAPALSMTVFYQIWAVAVNTIDACKSM